MSRFTKEPVSRASAEQRGQALDEPVAAALEVPRHELARHRRRLHRDVVDVAPPQQIHRARQATVRLLLAEHRLAEQVEVQPEALRAGLLQATLQPAAVGVDDQVADEGPEPAPRERHHDPGSPRGEPRAGAQHRPVGPADEVRQRRVRARQAGELPGRDVVVGRTGDAVDEAQGEVDPGRVVHEGGELRRGSGGRPGGAGPRPLVGTGDGPLDELVGDTAGGPVGGRRELLGHGSIVARSGRRGLVRIRRPRRRIDTTRRGILGPCPPRRESTRCSSSSASSPA